MINGVKKKNLRRKNRMGIIQIYKRWSKTNRIFFWIALIALFVGIIAIIFGHQIWYALWGNLKIDYKEGSFITINGTNYAQIEVVNNLGKTLENVSGRVYLNCSNINYEMESELFTLGEERVFLSEKDGSEFLFSPDPKLIDLVETKNNFCSDASFEIANYKPINGTHASLENAKIYDFFLEDGEIKIVEKEFVQKVAPLRKCVYCDIFIKISASNLKKTREKEEFHRFSGGKYSPSYYRSIIEIPLGISPYFAQTRITRTSGSDICKNNEENCSKMMCQMLANQYGVDLNCEESRLVYQIVTPPFEDEALYDSQIFDRALSEEEIKELYEKGPYG